jgi:tRNA (cmo5U34)-methyltransferase
MVKDQLFDRPDQLLYESFEFNAEVAHVFDDMVCRSVPCYDVIQCLLADLALRCHHGAPIWDLGCSTGNTLHEIISRASGPLELLGVDSSDEMLAACHRKLLPVVGEHRLQLTKGDLQEIASLPDRSAGVIILSLVAQFIRPLKRLPLCAMLLQKLCEGGVLLMVEKTLQPNRALNALFLDCYHSLKEGNGYSGLEIAKKREALENRLIPFEPEENLELLRHAGFEEAAVFFTWLNFQGYIAIKAGERIERSTHAAQHSPTAGPAVLFPAGDP